MILRAQSKWTVLRKNVNLLARGLFSPLFADLRTLEYGRGDDTSRNPDL